MDQKPYRAGGAPLKRAPGATIANPNHRGATPLQSPVASVKERKQLDKKVVISLIGVAAVLLAGWLAYQWLGIGGPVHKDEYQAVYTADGKAYFGKLRNITGAYLRLDDVYYLATAQGPQNGTSSSQASAPQLIHLGQEIHKPHDTMFVKSDQVIWWENIQNDGKVAQAIQEGKTQQP